MFHPQMAAGLAQLEGKPQAPGGIDEVSLVARSLEAEQVKLQQRRKNFPAPGQLLKDVRRGKRDVEEEGELPGVSALAQQGTDQHQVIVVDPDQAGAFGSGQRRAGKLPVGVAIALPVLRLKIAARLKIVE